MKIGSILSLALHFTRISITLFVLWLTFGWNVRKARKAFEKQLIRQGMAKKDAKRISANYVRLKNEITSALKRSFLRRI
ncbi:MAG: hypothetical protein ACUVTB_06105 [Candidatus Bathycorpusculaceae bacterium]